jgi:hypothetical protein
MMAVQKMDPNDPDPDQYRKFLGPGHVAQSIGQAIQTCWMMLPPERKTVDDLEKEFRRLVDRAFRDMRDDEKSFGKTRS